MAETERPGRPRRIRSSLFRLIIVAAMLAAYVAVTFRDGNLERLLPWF